MDTTVATTSARPSADAAGFLDTLRREQEQFLERLAAARALLGADESQLGQLSATHLRVTRRIFDAQRTMLQRRAEVDSEVAAIAAETEQHARTILASAVARSSTAAFAPPSADGLVEGAAPIRTLEAGTRRALLALGDLDRRARADASELAGLVDDAFRRAESDAVRMERELGALLDGWWAADRHEATALLDDARARAAVRLHAAHLDACAIDGHRLTMDDVAAPTSTVPPMRAESLPPTMRLVLDHPDGDLRAVLDALNAALGGPPGPATPISPTASSPSPSGSHVAGLPEPEPGEATDEQFLAFWNRVLPHDGATRHERPRAVGRFRTLMARVVLPVGAFTMVLTLAMAVIG